MKISAIYRFSFFLLSRAISSGGSIILTLVLIRRLEISESGEFFSAFTILNGLAILLNAGQAILLIRKISKPEISQFYANKIFCATSVNLSILSLSATIILSVLSILLLDNTKPIAWVWAPLIPILHLGLTSALFKARGNLVKGGILEPGFISTLTAFSIILFPEINALNLWYRLTAIAWTTMILSHHGLFYSQRSKIKIFKFKKSYFKEAQILWITSVLNYFSQWGGLVIATFILCNSDIAILNAIFRLIAPVQFISLTMDFYLASKFSQKVGSDLLLTRNTGRNYTLIFLIPYTLMIAVFAEPLIEFLYKGLSQHSEFYLRLLMVASLIQTGFGSNGMLLNMKNREFKVLYGTLARILSNFMILLLTYHQGLASFFFAFLFSVLIQETYYWYQVLILTNAGDEA